jgi:hypothetical protein
LKKGYCQIQNTSGSKLHIVGLATWDQVPFIDLQQPGAFNLALYPNQIGNAGIWGVTQVWGARPYLFIQDWKSED